MPQKFSHYQVETQVVKNAEGKRSLAIYIRDFEDEYNGSQFFLSPADAKILSKVIYQAARAMEQQPQKEK